MRFFTILLVLLASTTSSPQLRGAAASAALAQEDPAWRGQLAESVEQFLTEAESADAVFAEAVEKAVGATVRGESPEERLARVEAIQAQASAFREAGIMPTHDKLRRKAEQLVKRVMPMADACFDDHDRVVALLLDEGRAETARAVVDERDSLLGTSPYWLPAIPPHVRVNVEALRKHRPKFSKAHLDKSLDAVTRAGKGTDRLRFRLAIDAAAAATHATEVPDEPDGHPNSRKDTLLVLSTMRRGGWDLRELRFHRRDHRKRERITGLPGLSYD